MKALSGVAVVLGMLLLAASFLWTTLFPPERGWTTEKSERMAEVGGKASLLKFSIIEAQQKPSMHGGQNPAAMQAEYDKLKAEYTELHEEFTGARDGSKTAAKVLQWAGIAFVVAGGIVVFANRE